ncbi:MAG: hypothetical protein M1541_22185 [Acidobacteria bacterium]|nr:hypothetical protein [Acidobacteriota bacterium]
MSPADAELVELPDGKESLKAFARSLLLERDREKQRAEELRVEMLRLQLELERYKKWYYGPRADRLQSSGDVAQMLLDFAGELDRKPVRLSAALPAGRYLRAARTLCAKGGGR